MVLATGDLSAKVPGRIVGAPLVLLHVWEP